MSDNDAIVKRLNVLIRLMLDQQISEKKGMRKEQLVMMYSVGLTTGDIALILGQDSKNTSSQLKRAKDELKLKKSEGNND